MPLYEYEEGTSRKFYRIDLDGRRVRLHWGRIGTEGEHKISSFDTEREARDEYERQCRKRESDRHYTLVQDEGIPHDPEIVSRQRLAKAAPLSESPRFLFAKKKKFAWVEARGATLLSVKGLRSDEDKLGPETKTFDSPEAAVRARDAMVAKWLADGYELETFGAIEKREARVRVRNELADCSVLEAVVAEQPYDDGAWSVLEDFLLLQEDDPRSELIRLAKNKLRGEEAQARGACSGLLLGKKHASLAKAMGKTVWRGGYLVECEIALVARPAAALGALLAAPATRLLRDLELHIANPNVVAELCTVMGQAPCAGALRRLVLELGSLELESGLELDCEMLSGMRLQTLIVYSPVRLRSVSALSGLRELNVRMASLAALEKVLDGSLPELRTLLVNLYDSESRVDGDREWEREVVRVLGPMQSGAFAPNLSHVAMTLSSAATSLMVRGALRDGAMSYELELSP